MEYVIQTKGVDRTSLPYGMENAISLPLATSKRQQLQKIARFLSLNWVLWSDRNNMIFQNHTKLLSNFSSGSLTVLVSGMNNFQRASMYN